MELHRIRLVCEKMLTWYCLSTWGHRTLTMRRTGRPEPASGASCQHSDCNGLHLQSQDISSIKCQTIYAFRPLNPKPWLNCPRFTQFSPPSSQKSRNLDQGTISPVLASNSLSLQKSFLIKILVKPSSITWNRFLPLIFTSICHCPRIDVKRLTLLSNMIIPLSTATHLGAMYKNQSSLPSSTDPRLKIKVYIKITNSPAKI